MRHRQEVIPSMNSSDSKPVTPDTVLVTPPCRLAFPSLFKPSPRFRGSDRETYQATVLIPPDMDLAPFHRALVAAMTEKWGQVFALAGNGNPIRDAATKAQYQGYDAGWRFINANSGYAPAVVDQEVQPITDESVVYPGCWCRFFLSAYGWDHASGGKGVSFSLEGVQFVADGEPFASRADASSMFNPVAVPPGSTAAAARSQATPDAAAAAAAAVNPNDPAALADLFGGGF